MMKNIYLLRHAQTEWNRDKKIQGRMDSPLTEQGQQQAKAWGEWLKTFDIEIILASPQQRVVETVKLINTTLQKPFFYKDGFREQDWGMWEGLNLAEIHKHYPNELKKRTAKGWDFTAPKGETRLSVWQRAHRELQNTLQNITEENILLVCHQGVIKALLYRILGRQFLPTEKKILQKDNLHLISFNQEDNDFGVTELNLVPDLNPEKKI